MPPRVIPVLDLQAGRAVHAIGGDRAHYRPIRCPLHEGSDPIGLARAYRDVLGLRDLYVADLDAITGAPPSITLYRALIELGLSLWVDAGIRDASSLAPLLASDVPTIIVALETLRGPDALAEVLSLLGPDRTAFSLDLRAGTPQIAAGADWRTTDPRALAETALTLGIHRLLLLDLSRVGTGQGVGTLPLLHELSAAHPECAFIVGGGIARRDDLSSMEQAGASALLIGSALRDGRIGRDDLTAAFRSPE